MGSGHGAVLSRGHGRWANCGWPGDERTRRPLTATQRGVS
ncbi:hypothetical protein C791_3733 [Amycolatopsis azurea DSM 43854]|uniref:Uncharacterized protein n=1 Tax=Amycolatopsis azurea DSM 43854 TaxID=1238180 RepID=M2Q2J0_9PSEU|nr:hypothetical protein C791_3733 [Amycolatopsis azurea DSM 43854]